MDSILTRINSFRQWHYQFDLNGHLTPIHNQSKINRHLQRKHYFFDVLVDLCGGSLKGKRILDLGCNAGFWSLQSVDNQCEYVLGIDGRSMHIEQANFVFELKKIPQEQYQFIHADIFEFDWSSQPPFDIILLLGLLYHVNKPIELLKNISQINSDILLIDTSISPKEGSLLEIRHEEIQDPRNAIADGLVFLPTEKAVIDLVRNFGYNVDILCPNFDDYSGAEDYANGVRKAFIASKKTPLLHRSFEVIPPMPRTR